MTQPSEIGGGAKKRIRVADLTKDDEQKRIRVAAVAMSEAERLGYVNDTERLRGQTGRLTRANMGQGVCVQAFVEWDGVLPGKLALAPLDEIEFE